MDFDVDFKFGFSSHPMQGNPRRSWILDSTPVLDFGFHAVDFRIPGTGFLIFLLELGFRGPVVGGIPDSKDQDFVFHKNLFRIPDSSSKTFHPYMG